MPESSVHQESSPPTPWNGSTRMRFALGEAVRALVNEDNGKERKIAGVVVGYNIQVRPGAKTAQYVVEFLQVKYGSVENASLVLSEASLLPYFDQEKAKTEADF